jgi:polyhydroxyalkanoate synthase
VSQAAPDERMGLRLRNLLGLLKRPKPVVGATPADVVLRENKMELLRYRPRPEGPRYRTPVVMVPSMINRHYVLDLRPGASFVEHLVNEGHDVYMVRWGTPGRRGPLPHLRRGVRRLPRARDPPRGADDAARSGPRAGLLHGRHDGGDPRLGAARARRLAGDAGGAGRFRDEAILSTWAANESFDVGAMTAALGNAPWRLLQGTFHDAAPDDEPRQAGGPRRPRVGREWLDAFLALETWVNDNVSLPGEAFREYIERLYKNESLIAGEFALSGERVRLENLTMPLARGDLRARPHRAVEERRRARRARGLGRQGAAPPEGRPRRRGGVAQGGAGPLVEAVGAGLWGVVTAWAQRTGLTSSCTAPPGSRSWGPSPLSSRAARRNRATWTRPLLNTVRRPRDLDPTLHPSCPATARPRSHPCVALSGDCVTSRSPFIQAVRRPCDLDPTLRPSCSATVRPRSHPCLARSRQRTKRVTSRSCGRQTA